MRTTSPPAYAAAHTVPGAQVEDWAGCGTCPDCFLGSFNYRPKSSVQYIMALSNSDQASVDPMRFHFGFIASSDNHSARPGTGYKEYDRIPNTEARGARDATWYARVNEGIPTEKTPESVPFDFEHSNLLNFQVLDFERQASFFLTGGLVAVHATGRNREAIWDALERREVYGTSGERILLWFDLLNAPTGTVSMGGDAKLAEAPRFRVRAAGALEAGGRLRRVAARRDLDGASGETVPRRVLQPDRRAAPHQPHRSGADPPARAAPTKPSAT